MTAVFTDPNSGRVLNVATVTPELAVVVLDTPQGLRSFAGPISSYREFVGRRLDDRQWKQMLEHGKGAPAPDWTDSYRAGDANVPRPHTDEKSLNEEEHERRRRQRQRKQKKER